jgi:putative hydrolase of the HAD superfamily
MQKLPPDGRRFDLVLFDLGNTLIYFDGEWNEVLPRAHQALAKALIQTGFQLDFDSFVEDFGRRVIAAWEDRNASNIEHSMEYVLRQVLHDFGVEDTPTDLLRPAIDAMFTISQAHWHLEADTIHMLDQLREQGYALGLISNASDNTDVQTLVDKAGVRHYFDQILVSAAVGIRKPDPYIFQLALDHFAVQPEQAVMVGDTLAADVRGAQNIGMASVWITRRAENPDNHEHRASVIPDASISTLAELPGLLVHWQDRRPR